MKTPVIRKPDYTVFYEWFEGYTFIHCDCYKWNKTVRNSLKEDWDKLISVHGEPVYAMHDIGDNKHLKFLSLMGFEYHTNFVGTDGQEHQVYVRK